MQSIQLATFDVDGLQTRLKKMSDEELRKFGEAARYVVSPTAVFCLIGHQLQIMPWATAVVIF